MGVPIETLSQFSYTRKIFPSPTGHRPNELVSRSHVGHLQHLIRYAIEQLFYSVDLPYLSKCDSQHQNQSPSALTAILAHRNLYELYMKWQIHILLY